MSIYFDLVVAGGLPLLAIDRVKIYVRIFRRVIITIPDRRYLGRSDRSLERTAIRSLDLKK